MIDATDNKIMTYEDFKKEHMEPNKRFDFSKFKIVCKSCGGEKIEFGGEMNSDWSGCYYPGETPDNTLIIICKCHDCGNAFKMMENYYEPTRDG